MSRTFYIDSENVGDNWVSLLDIVTDEDDILVFYTGKSPHMNYRNVIRLKESPKEVVFIECNEGNNALDFQLCTELGFRVHDMGDGDFIIVSNDTGFDAVVKYWRRRNISIKRIPGKACATLPGPTYQGVKALPMKNKVANAPATDSVPTEESAPAVSHEPIPATEPLPATESNTKAEPVPEEKSVMVPAPETEPVLAPNQEPVPAPKQEPVPAPKQEPVPAPKAESAAEEIDDRAKEILYLIGKDNLQLLHESLQQLFGAQKSQYYYNAFKAKDAYSSFLANHKPMSLEEKHLAYCQIVFEISDPDLKVPADFPKFVVDTWRKKKNLNSFRASIQGKYGKENRDKYYALIKAHVKILDKIK